MLGKITKTMNMLSTEKRRLPPKLHSRHSQRRGNNIKCRPLLGKTITKGTFVSRSAQACTLALGPQIGGQQQRRLTNREHQKPRGNLAR